MLWDKSITLYQKARELIPGGVNSPVRACRRVGVEPLFISCGHSLQCGTLSLLTPEVYAYLETLTERLTHGLKNAADAADIPAQVKRAGFMAGLFFCPRTSI